MIKQWNNCAAANNNTVFHFLMKPCYAAVQTAHEEIKTVSSVIKDNYKGSNGSSSVARGGGGPPIGLKSMQNSVFLALLMLIFALKMKIAPPFGNWG